MDDWYRKTERLLYDHKLKPTRILGKKYDLDLVLSTMFPRETPSYDSVQVQSGDISDPTYTYAQRRVEGPEVMAAKREITRLEKELAVVDGVLKVATEQQRELYELKYRAQVKSMKTIADRMQVSRETASNVRDELVRAVAECMGYLVEDKTA